MAVTISLVMDAPVPQQDSVILPRLLPMMLRSPVEIVLLPFQSRTIFTYTHRLSLSNGLIVYLLAIDSLGNERTNIFCAVKAAWLNVSQPCRVGIGMNWFAGVGWGV